MHARCDNRGRPFGFALSGGQVSDYETTDAVMAFPAPNPEAMLADRGYDSDCFRQDLLFRGILPVIPSRKGRNAPQKTDWRRYKDRNRRTLCSFGWPISSTMCATSFSSSRVNASA
ncbi:transposase [Asaia lannensis]|uniref:transposase n=1 Tax=Asaia lannensis TaxID=415421 RepID=UPI0021BD1951